MARSKKHQSDSEGVHENENDRLSTGFLAAMRFNALKRGMKWKDTYDLTAEVSQK